MFWVLSEITIIQNHIGKVQNYLCMRLSQSSKAKCNLGFYAWLFSHNNMDIRLLCIHLSTCWRPFHLPVLISSFLFQPAVALPTAVNGRPSEISDFKSSVEVCLLTVSTQMKNVPHFGYNACQVNFIFCSSSRSVEHLIHSLILINYYCNISIF